MPGVVGVPVSSPVVGLRDNPPGKAPPDTDHAYGGFPPVAAIVCAYAALTSPSGSGDAVGMVRAGLTVSAKSLVEPRLFASVTLMVKWVVPEPVGLPLIAPPVGFSVNPPGSVPPETDQT